MSAQRIHAIEPITVNGIRVVRVIIDAHYELKHAATISDVLILELVQKLDGRFELPETKEGSYSYFATLLEVELKQYRLVWLLEDGEIYVGVVNAYRDKRRK